MKRRADSIREREGKGKEDISVLSGPMASSVPILQEIRHVHQPPLPVLQCKGQDFALSKI